MQWGGMLRQSLVKPSHHVAEAPLSFPANVSLQSSIFLPPI